MTIRSPDVEHVFDITADLTSDGWQLVGLDWNGDLFVIPGRPTVDGADLGFAFPRSRLEGIGRNAHWQALTEGGDPGAGTHFTD